MADELLFGKLEHGGAVKVLVEGEGADAKLAFEYFPAEPKPPEGDDDDDNDDDDGKPGDDDPALISADAEPKALPGPKGRTGPKPQSGTVPSVPKKSGD